MRCHLILPLMTSCLLACLASCGGPEQHQTRVTPPAPAVSTSAENEVYRRALDESDLAVQINLLVNSLRLGCVDAGARLIALGR